MENLKITFIKGVAYTAVAKYAGIAVSLLLTSILARLLDPSDFGVIAVASIFISFVNLITDFGIGPAIIQRNNLDEADLNSLFSFTALLGLVSSLIVFTLSEIIADYYESPLLCDIFKILSINLLFAALNIVPNALLLKDKLFKAIAIRTITVQIISGVICIILAFNGVGVYSLAIQSIMSSILIFFINYHLKPLRLFSKIYYSSLKKVFTFSIYQFLAQLFNYFTKDLDKLLLGKKFDMISLGYYEKSYRLVQLPVGNLSYVLAPVMQPVFKELQNDLKQMMNKYTKMLAILASIAMPLSAFLFFEGSDIIYIVFGAKWMQAVPAFCYLSLGIGFNIMLSTTGPILLASNRVDLSFYNCIVEFLISISCIWIGLMLGSIETLAIMVSIGLLIRFIYVFIVIIKVAFHESLSLFIRSTGRSVILLIVGILLFFSVSLFFNDEFSLLRFIINVAIFMVLMIQPLSQLKSLLKK